MSHVKIPSKRNEDVTKTEKASKPVERPKIKPFAATWWLDPVGYEWRTGLAPLDTTLGFERTKSGRMYPWTDQSVGDYEFFDDVQPDEDGYDPAKQWDSAEVPWLVAKGFVPSYSISGWMDVEFDNGVLEYEPLKVQGLHREFGTLGPDPAAMAAFAARYGLLGGDTRMLESANPVPGEPIESYFGEALEDWLVEVDLMHTLLMIWDMYRDPATDEFAFYDIVYLDCEAAFVCDRWRERDSVRYLHPLMLREYYFPGHGLPDRDNSAEPLMRHVARTVLCNIVSDMLQTHTRPVIDALPGSQVQLVPTDLLGSIYVSFMQEILGRTVPTIRCASCGRWFIPRKRARTFCTTACKQKAYRARKSG